MTYTLQDAEDAEADAAVKGPIFNTAKVAHDVAKAAHDAAVVALEADPANQALIDDEATKAADRATKAADASTKNATLRSATALLVLCCKDVGATEIEDAKVALQIANMAACDLMNDEIELLADNEFGPRWCKGPKGESVLRNTANVAETDGWTRRNDIALLAYVGQAGKAGVSLTDYLGALSAKLGTVTYDSQNRATWTYDETAWDALGL